MRVRWQHCIPVEVLMEAHSDKEYEALSKASQHTGEVVATVRAFGQTRFVIKPDDQQEFVEVPVRDCTPNSRLHLALEDQDERT